jgi:hypothetical protein
MVCWGWGGSAVFAVQPRHIGLDRQQFTDAAAPIPAGPRSGSQARCRFPARAPGAQCGQAAEA